MAAVLRAVRGASFREPLTLLGRDGAPLNLTGASLRWVAKRRLEDDDDDAVLVATSADGTLDIVDAPTGSIQFDVPAASMTMEAYPTLYAWTLQVVSGGVTTRFPDAFQGGPGKLIVAPSAVE